MTLFVGFSSMMHFGAVILFSNIAQLEVIICRLKITKHLHKIMDTYTVTTGFVFFSCAPSRGLRDIDSYSLILIELQGLCHIDRWTGTTKGHSISCLDNFWIPHIFWREYNSFINHFLTILLTKDNLHTELITTKHKAKINRYYSSMFGKLLNKHKKVIMNHFIIYTHKKYKKEAYKFVSVEYTNIIPKMLKTCLQSKNMLH